MGLGRQGDWRRASIKNEVRAHTHLDKNTADGYWFSDPLTAFKVWINSVQAEVRNGIRKGEASVYMEECTSQRTLYSGQDTRLWPVDLKSTH